MEEHVIMDVCYQLHYTNQWRHDRGVEAGISAIKTNSRAEKSQINTSSKRAKKKLPLPQHTSRRAMYVHKTVLCLEYTLLFWKYVQA